MNQHSRRYGDIGGRRDNPDDEFRSRSESERQRSEGWSDERRQPERSGSSYGAGRYEGDKQRTGYQGGGGYQGGSYQGGGGYQGGGRYQGGGYQGRESQMGGYGGQQPHYDPDYHQWREQQMRDLDNDYEHWRQERYKKFSEEFNQWRSSRQAGQPSKGPGSASADTGMTSGGSVTGGSPTSSSTKSGGKTS